MFRTFVNVYYQYWDDDWNSPIENDLIYEETFFLDSIDVDSLGSSLNNLIGMNKGDGFYFEIYKLKRDNIINIFLISSKGEEVDIQFVNDFFESISSRPLKYVEQKSTREESESESKSEEKYYIYLENVTNEDLQELQNVIREEGFTYASASEEIKIFEKGASNYVMSLLLEVSTLIGGVSGTIALNQYIKSKFEDHSTRTSSGNYDFNRLTARISEITGVNVNDLSVTGFIDEGSILKVKLVSRYKDFEVECDKKLNITSIKTLHKSHTMV